MGQGCRIFIKFGAGGGEIDQHFIAEAQGGRAETFMTGNQTKAFVLLYEPVGQRNGWSLDDKVEIKVGQMQEKITHKTAYGINSQAQLISGSTNRLDGFVQNSRQLGQMLGKADLLPVAMHRAPSRLVELLINMSTPRISRQRIENILPIDETGKTPLLVYNRQPPNILANHELLHLIQSGMFVHAYHRMTHKARYFGMA
ncbi:MAG: hypothetical protein BWY75_01763 [bacterium ADurb.Bin425]|nr:MAG: hypothetical protein BWY75_01763 [bacterium ADurb.Bin425]